MQRPTLTITSIGAILISLLFTSWLPVASADTFTAYLYDGIDERYQIYGGAGTRHYFRIELVDGGPVDVLIMSQGIRGSEYVYSEHNNFTLSNDAQTSKSFVFVEPEMDPSEMYYLDLITHGKTTAIVKVTWSIDGFERTCTEGFLHDREYLIPLAGLIILLLTYIGFRLHIRSLKNKDGIK